jgi:hypothetical protein
MRTCPRSSAFLPQTYLDALHASALEGASQSWQKNKFSRKNFNKPDKD